MSKAFAENMGALRKASGQSQREAAAGLKISQALLSHYENGAREPGLDFVGARLRLLRRERRLPARALRGARGREPGARRAGRACGEAS